MPDWSFRLLGGGNDSHRRLHRACGRLLRYTPPIAKKDVFWYSRFLPISTRDSEGADLVFSVVCLADLRSSRVGPPQIWYSQGISPSDYYSWFGEVGHREVVHLYRRAAEVAAVMLVATECCAVRIRALCGELPCPIRVVPQMSFSRVPCQVRTRGRDRLRLLFVGRDYRRKGLLDILRIYPHLRSRYRHIELTIVSRPDPFLRAAVEGLPDVRICSDISSDDLDHLYETSDILVVPTHADTFNLTLVEGMAKGCVIVSSNLEPMPEIAPHNEAGLLVPQGDTEALESALTSLIEDDATRFRLAEACRRRYQQHFSPEVVVPKLCDAFDFALGIKRSFA